MSLASPKECILQDNAALNAKLQEAEQFAPKLLEAEEVCIMLSIVSAGHSFVLGP